MEHLFGRNGEAKSKRVRSAECPSEPQANGLTDEMDSSCFFGIQVPSWQ